MSKILELTEKRAKAWETAKAFLDAKRNADGFVSAEDAATYEKMEADVQNLTTEIERLARQQAIDDKLAQATSKPITMQPNAQMEAEIAKTRQKRKASCSIGKVMWRCICKTEAPSILAASKYSSGIERMLV